MNLSALDAICHTALDAVVAVNHYGLIVGFNGEAEQLFGYPATYAIGKPMADLIVPERYRAAHNAGMERFLQSGEPKLIGGKVEIEALHSSGIEIPVELGLSILQIGDDTVFLSFLRDLRERRQREADIQTARDKAEQANAAKSFVVSMVAHDMRNALGGVIGNLALLDRYRLTREEQEIINGIEDGARALKRLLSDTLDLARLEAGEIEISPASVAVEDFVTELSQVWETRLAEAQVKMSVTIAKEAPQSVYLDRHRLRQVVSNLISNATKYAAGSSLALSIEPCGVEGMRITVSDNGPGFSEAALKTAFEPFLRPTGQCSDGSGLGLSIVKTITEAMNGRITLDTAAGAGSRVVLEFDECRLEQTSGNMTAAPDLKALAVLLVEDNATNRLVAAKMLEKIGCDVTLCEDGLSGAETAESIGFDVIFMDIDLPKLNGKDAIRRIRTGDGPNAVTPVVAFTAFAIRSQREDILAAGASTILTKPVSGPEDFSKTLTQVLGQRRQTTEAGGPAHTVLMDTSRLMSLRDTLGVEDFTVLSAEFRKDMSDILLQLTDTDRDHVSLRKASHIAISLMGTLGAGRAQLAAERLHAMTEDGTADELEACRHVFEAVLRETLTALNSFLEAS